MAVSTFAPGGIVIKEAPLLSVTVSGSTDGLFDEADDPTPASQQAKAKFSQAIRNLQSRDVEEYAKFQALFYHLPQQPQGTITTVPQRRQPLRSSRRAITEKEDLSRASHNAFSETFVDNDGHTKTALRIFNDISRFNHSCRPNAHYYWDETQQRGVVRATERISPGTEITITYISDEGFNNAATRQDFYNEHYHFTCQCIACGGEQSMTVQVQMWRDGSDRRRMTAHDQLITLRQYAPLNRRETEEQRQTRLKPKKSLQRDPISSCTKQAN